MQVTMQIDRGALGVYVRDAGHTYSVSELARIIRQLTAAKNWLAAERVKQTVPTVVEKAKAEAK